MTTFDVLMEIAALEDRDMVRIHEITEKVMALSQAIDALSEADHWIVMLRLQGLTQEQVGKEVGLSQRQVSYRLWLMKPSFKRVLETR